jgi:hypothetical protein
MSSPTITLELDCSDGDAMALYEVLRDLLMLLPFQAITGLDLSNREVEGD